jgi:hypothetical protein
MAHKNKADKLAYDKSYNENIRKPREQAKKKDEEEAKARREQEKAETEEAKRQRNRELSKIRMQKKRARDSQASLFEPLHSIFPDRLQFAESD